LALLPKTTPCMSMSINRSMQFLVTRAGVIGLQLLC
jgi:hypothetical protein